MLAIAEITKIRKPLFKLFASLYLYHFVHVFLGTDSSISKASNSNSGSESSERLEKDPKPVGPAPTFDVSCESGKTGFSGDNSDPPTTSSSSMTPNPNIEDIEEDKSCKSEGPIPTINLNFKNER